MQCHIDALGSFHTYKLSCFLPDRLITRMPKLRTSKSEIAQCMTIVHDCFVRLGLGFSSPSKASPTPMRPPNSTPHAAPRQVAPRVHRVVVQNPVSNMLWTVALLLASIASTNGVIQSNPKLNPNMAPMNAAREPQYEADLTKATPTMGIASRSVNWRMFSEPFFGCSVVAAS